MQLLINTVYSPGLFQAVVSEHGAFHTDDPQCEGTKGEGSTAEHWSSFMLVLVS